MKQINLQELSQVERFNRVYFGVLGCLVILLRHFDWSKKI